jgi:hypothetical protein
MSRISEEFCSVRSAPDADDILIFLVQHDLATSVKKTGRSTTSFVGRGSVTPSSTSLVSFAKSRVS